MPETSDAKPETRPVNIALEMRGAVVELAGSRQSSDTRESMIARAARRAGISFRQAKAFFYGEVSNPRVDAVERVRAAVRANNKQTEAEVSGRGELMELRQRIARLEAAYASPVPNMVGEAGGLHRALDGGRDGSRGAVDRALAGR